jgi:hypothetical protein
MLYEGKLEPHIVYQYHKIQYDTIKYNETQRNATTTQYNKIRRNITTNNADSKPNAI